MGNQGFKIANVDYIDNVSQIGQTKPYLKNVKKFNIPNTGYFYYSIWINKGHYRSPIKGSEFGTGKLLNKKREHYSKKHFLKCVKIDLEEREAQS